MKGILALRHSSGYQNATHKNISFEVFLAEPRGTRGNRGKSIKNVSKYAAKMNKQIREERDKVALVMKELKQGIAEFETKIKAKANQTSEDNFLVFLAEDVAQLNEQQSNLQRKLREQEIRHRLLKRIPIETLKTHIKELRKNWKEVGHTNELPMFIEKVISKIVVTNEAVKAYVDYDTITQSLCSFEMVVDEIERDRLLIRQPKA